MSTRSPLLHATQAQPSTELNLTMLLNTPLRLSLLPHLNRSTLWPPAHTIPSRRNLIIQLVDLFQSQPFGLVDHKIHKANADEAAPKPDKEDLGLQVRVAIAVVD